MPVYYEELPGSPEISLERRTGSGTRRVIISWHDIEAFMDEIFPDPLTGYLYGAVMPGYPFLVATKVGIKPFVETSPRADVDDWTAWHSWAELNVEYGVPRDDQQQQSGPSGDHTGPGGSAGSSGGEEVTFLSHKVKVGGEFLTYPHGALEWEENARTDGDPERSAVGPTFEATVASDFAAGAMTIFVKEFNVPRGRGLVVDQTEEGDTPCRISGFLTTGDRRIQIKLAESITFGKAAGETVYIYAKVAGDRDQKDVPEKTTTAVVVPTIEHDLEWNYVVNPPWAAVRNTIGRVNAYPMAGAPPECLLFQGAECSREVTNKGLKRWKMSYKMTEKNQNANDPTKPMGWNYFLRPDGDRAGRFQRLGRKATLQANGNPYFTFTTGGVTPTSTIFVVDSTGDPLPQEGAFWMKIEDEVVQVNNIISSTEWAVTRGIKRTTAAAHATGSVVESVPSGIYEIADFRFLFNFIG